MLRSEIRSNQLELNDLETDEGVLKSQIDQRLIDIEKLKNELYNLHGNYRLNQLIARSWVSKGSS